MTDETDAPARRLLASAIQDRCRFERMLHDGVQQDLIALAVQLELLQQQPGTGSGPASEPIAAMRRETLEALDRVRELAAEIYPATLDVRGLADALRTAARAARLDVRIESSTELRREPREVEAAVFFFCRAAMRSNGSDRTLTISLGEQDGDLRVEVTGDGSLSALDLDALEAVGGTVTVSSTGDSVRITAVLPSSPGYSDSDR